MFMIKKGEARGRGKRESVGMGREGRGKEGAEEGRGRGRRIKEVGEGGTPQRGKQPNFGASWG